MALCVEINGSGQIVQSTGAYPECSEFALMTAQEIQAMTAVFPPLSFADGVQISLAILSVWAVGLGLRMTLQLILNRR